MSIVYAGLALAEIFVLFASVIALLALAARGVVRTLFSGKEQKRTTRKASSGPWPILRAAPSSAHRLG